MEKLTDRAAYLLGLTKGMNLEAEKNENKLLMETLKLIEELAQEVTDLENDAQELGDYIEDLDRDLGEAETIVYGDEDCCCEDCQDCAQEEDETKESEEEISEDQPSGENSYGCECDEEGHVHFDCPNCGKLVSLTLEDLDDEKSLKCQFCGEPFFTEPGEEDGKNGKKDKKKKKHKK